ncbi:MAG: RIP metalloprotease RseP [Clostridia bacterium]|nr:RIP metalloprotease RseP [Clostridia bacterium]
MSILMGILALSFLIIVHELGHFTVAKLAGIKVLEFALFMGPKLISFKRGETTYSIRAVPLGGFVKMEGEEEASEDERSYSKQPIWVRSLVIAAGPVMNLIVAVILVAVMFGLNGYGTTKVTVLEENTPLTAAGLKQGDKILEINGNKIYSLKDYGLFMHIAKSNPSQVKILRDGASTPEIITVIPEKKREVAFYQLGFMPEPRPSNIVGSVDPDTPAAKAGLQKGDVIIKLNDREVKDKQSIGKYLNENKTNPVAITVNRNGNNLVLTSVVPKEIKGSYENYSGAIRMGHEKGNFKETIGQAFVYSYSIARQVYYSLGLLIQGKVGLNEMMGPVGIVSLIGDVIVVQQSTFDKFIWLLDFTALISINLGLFNLIPFPALDGSKLVLLGIEGIRRKALPPEKEAYITMVGLVLLIILMIFTTSNDIMRLITGY